MTKQPDLHMKKGDSLAIFLVVLLAVAAALLYLPPKDTGPVQAEIYQNGELIRVLPLKTDAHLEIRGKYTNVITVENGTIAITASDCPGEDCVHSGAVSTPGRSLVCLPNGVEIRLCGPGGDVDFVVG